MKKNKNAIYISTPRPRIRRLPKRSRHIPYRGQPVEAFEFNKLARCWYCGVINTVGREEEDTGRSMMASSYSDQTVQSQGFHTAGPNKAKAAISVNRSVFTYRMTPLAGQDGTPRTVKNILKPIAHTGCRGCGTINWQGKY